MLQKRGFTLIELLVVISIIAIIVSILLPSLNAAKKIASCASSAMTLSAWGKGTMIWTTDNDGILPFEGKKQPGDMGGTGGIGNPTWWANAVPPYAGGSAYQDIAANLGNNVPVPPQKTIFTDPAAQKSHDAPYSGGSGANSFKFYFNYVVNSELDNSITDKYGPSGFEKERMPLARIPSTCSTILMIELRSVPTELSQDDRYYGNPYGIVPSTGEEIGLKRCRGDMKYLAKRYKGGTNLLFCDGHVGWFNYKYLTDPSYNTSETDTNPSNSTYGQTVSSWNRSDVVWNPLGATTEE